MRAVGGKGPAVDFQYQGHALPLDIAGWESQPTFDRHPVMAGRGRDLAHLAHHLRLTQGAVEIGQDTRVAAAREAQFGGARRRPAGRRDRVIVRNREAPPGIGPVEPAAGKPLNDIADRSVERDARHAGLPRDIVLGIDGAAIGSPFDARGAEVPIPGQQAPVRSIAIHHVEIVVLVSAQCIVEAEIGDSAPIGRNAGAVIGAVAAGQLRDAPAHDVEGVNFAL